MFKVLKYSLDQVSGSVELKVIFQLTAKSESVMDGGMFTSQQDADRWLTKIKKDYIMRKIEKYVTHKAKIIESGEGRKSLRRLNSLDRCYAFILWAGRRENSLDKICRYAVVIRDHFENILPHEKNDSYLSSRENLTEIMSFCKEQYELKKAG